MKNFVANKATTRNRIVFTRKYSTCAPTFGTSNPASGSQSTANASSPHSILFYLNGEPREICADTIDPGKTLLDYLRDNELLTGSKLTCGEGGCGACTVDVATWNQTEGKVEHRSVNSCLCPVFAVDGAEVTTVEGVNRKKTTNNNGNDSTSRSRPLHQPQQEEMHLIQQAMTENFGSQCGYCTPGFVATLYSALQANPLASRDALLEAVSSNLCRCTGYRPIVSAIDDIVTRMANLRAATSEGSSQNADQSFPSQLQSYLTSAQNPASAWSGPSMKLIRGQYTTWLAPTCLEDLLRAKAECPTAKIVCGNTEVGIETRFGRKEYPHCISPVHVPELHHYKMTEEAFEIGAALPLSTLLHTLEEYLFGTVGMTVRHQVARALVDQLKWFSGPAIRNVASIGGNIATASPISDLNPVFIALGADFVLQSQARGRRVVNAQKFFLGYRKTAMEPDEVLVQAIVPIPPANSYVRAFHLKRRREDDIAIVTCCFSVTLADEKPPMRGQRKIARVVKFSSAFGGIAPVTRHTHEFDAWLTGREWNDQTLLEAMKVLAQLTTLPSNVPGGQPEYRSSLCVGFFYKFYMSVRMTHLGDLNPNLISALGMLHPTPPRGQQRIEATCSEETMAPVGKAVQHSSGVKQVLGTAQYTTDIPPRHLELRASLVVSSIPHGRIKSIDASKALEIPGVVGFYCHKDVPGVNKIGDIIADEEIFASEIVVNVGQPIGVIIAETEDIARRASALVQVQYETLEPILSIADAVEKGSFYELYQNQIVRGDVESAFKAADHVIEGHLKIGGQEHFYFEPQTSLVECVEGEVKVHSSTQNLKMTQLMISKALGIDANKITVTSKRIGGGFGGKETQFVYACIAAIASHHANRPVRLLLARDEDMKWTGHRHPFMGKYKVGFSKDGLIQALDVIYYNNGGSSYDLSGPVIERAMLHADNAYRVPHVRVRGKIAKTNCVSNTAFRGFGGPQGTLVAEQWIEQVAHALKVSPEQIRRKNLYKPGDTTHFKMPVNTRYDEMWEKCLQKMDFHARQQEVDRFNSENRHRKKGLSIVPSKFGLSFTFATLNQGSSLVHIYTDGSVLISHGGVEMGQGLHTKVLQVASQALGIPIERIHISETATDKVANSSATAASMGSDIYGMATFNACQILQERLAPLRVKYAGCTWDELIKHAWLDRIDLSARGFTKVPTTGWNWAKGEGQPFHYFTSGVAASEVVIDTLTGDSRILKSEIVFDVGKTLNPTIDIGQIEGAFVQGFGWMTLEELIWGDKDHPWIKPGHMQTAGPGAYKIPSVDDIPREFNVTLVNASENSHAIHSSRGIGEPPILLSSSVVFALRAAISAAREQNGHKEFFEMHLPVTSERVRMACADPITALCVKEDYGRGNHVNFQARGSW